MKRFKNIEIAVTQAERMNEIVLDDLKRNFDANLLPDGIPITVGHPWDETFSYGWVKKLKRENDSLFMDADLHGDMVKWITEGMLRNRSIGYYINYDGSGEKVLSHVAMLGALNPALRGMRPIELSLNNLFSYEQLKADVKEKLQKVKLDESKIVCHSFGDDNIMEFETVETVKSEINLDENQEQSKEGENQMKTYSKEELDAFLIAKESEIEKKFSIEIIALNGQIAEKDVEIKGLKGEVKTLNEKVENSSDEAFVSILLSEKKIKPAEKDNVVELLSLQSGQAKKKYKEILSDRNPSAVFDKETKKFQDPKDTGADPEDGKTLKQIRDDARAKVTA